VLALLALALFPVSAFAGNAGETVYTPEVPTIESEPSTSTSKPAHHSSPNTGKSETGRATGSNAETGESSMEEGESEGGSSEGHKSKEGSSSKN
jgi:hypothetical protein